MLSSTCALLFAFNVLHCFLPSTCCIAFIAFCLQYAALLFAFRVLRCFFPQRAVLLFAFDMLHCFLPSTCCTAFNVFLISNSSPYYVSNTTQSSKVFLVGGPFVDFLRRTDQRRKTFEAFLIGSFCKFVVNNHFHYTNYLGVLKIFIEILGKVKNQASPEFRAVLFNLSPLPQSLLTYFANQI